LPFILVLIRRFLFCNQDAGLEFEVTPKGTLIIKHGQDELNGKVIKLVVTKRSSGSYSITVNGKATSAAGFAISPPLAKRVILRLIGFFVLCPGSAAAAAPGEVSAGAEAIGEEGAAVGGAAFQEAIEEARRRLDELERLLLAPPARDTASSKTQALVTLFFFSFFSIWFSN